VGSIWAPAFAGESGVGMAGGLKIYATRLTRSLITLPTGRGWAVCLAISSVTVAGMALLGFSTGLYRLTPTQPDLLQRMALVFFIPALGEEIIFRGLLVPTLHDKTEAVWPIRISVTLYVFWHVLEALTFLPGAASVFLRPDFLVCCAFLGFGCAIMRHITGSLWPAVLLHWALVVVWQTWWGGVSALG
jgi:predicted Abi (CAAX) family protease